MHEATTDIIVSIPNGMEFYDDAYWINFLNNSFNSQRDGILQINFRFFDLFIKFQFPTGWNSTVLKKIRVVVGGWFQFPTGWNSTIDLLQ